MIRLIDYYAIQGFHLNRTSDRGGFGVGAFLDKNGDVVWTDAILLTVYSRDSWSLDDMRTSHQVQPDLVAVGGVRAEMWRTPLQESFVLLSKGRALPVLSRYRYKPNRYVEGVDVGEVVESIRRFRASRVQKLLNLRSIAPLRDQPHKGGDDAFPSYDAPILSSAKELREAAERRFSRASVDAEILRLIPYTNARYAPSCTST